MASVTYCHCCLLRLVVMRADALELGSLLMNGRALSECQLVETKDTSGGQGRLGLESATSAGIIHINQRAGESIKLICISLVVYAVAAAADK